MKKRKSRLLAILGSVSTAIGSIGAGLGSIGLCTCVLVPIFSIAGVLNLIGVFVTEAKLFFLVSGMIMLLISLVLKGKKCKIHKKGK